MAKSRWQRREQMPCPRCGFRFSFTKAAAVQQGNVLRLRRCLRMDCRHEWTTIEQSEDVALALLEKPPDVPRVLRGIA